MRKLIFLVLLVLAAGVARAQNISGDWTGVLDAGSGMTLHLVLHVTKASSGSFSATLDSVDQNALGIPVKAVTLTGAKLWLDVPAVHGTYVGMVAGDGKTIAGTWTQSVSLPLTFTRAAAKVETKPVAPSDIDGAWSGTLDTGSVKLRLVFHVMNTANGLKATMDSVDQGANGIPIGTVTRKESSIRFDAPAINGVYDAKIAGDRMDGTWSQNGHSLPLVLQRVKNASELVPRRPQEPKPPFPYAERDVQYENKLGSVTLAGTLTIPQGSGPFPAVLLIAGSGAHDRNEALMGHKPFLVLADYLARRGIVVLRSDKRGVGESDGVYATATTNDFALDAAAGVAFLQTVPQVDRRRIGLVGHSEGGIIAPIVAVQNPDVAFIVLMAGSGVPGDRIIVDQVRLIAEADGATAEQAAAAAARQQAILDLVKKGDTAQLRSTLREKLPEAAVGSSIAELTSPWYRNFIAYDPATALRKVKCPVLALAGSKDLQVPPRENLAAIRAALEAGGNRHVQTVELPGLNHLFQHARSGSPSEYASIEETMAPEAMEKIAGWVSGERR